MADTNVLKQIVDKIKDSNTVLVTVNTNPTVDELSAALGITLLINKINKHATAVFSGNVPPAIEFLNPEKTFEHTVDSLRDFIIALDKEKADHLRYKVVDDMVKIFITPYRTTINENDLEFSQGDYNVEVVLAIGVRAEEDLDRALASHGRILHDATVATISLGEPTKLGGIEWNDAGASSYSELLLQLAEGLKGEKNLLDEQIATAFLTGIVAATERFSKAKTTSKAMTMAAQLMSAGANQQLIATKLQEEGVSVNASGDKAAPSQDAAPSDLPKDTVSSTPDAVDDGKGALSISHVPEGTVEQVTEEIQSNNAKEALGKVEEELSKQTSHVAAQNQEDATEVAEKKLAEELAVPEAPSAEDLQAKLSADLGALGEAMIKPEERELVEPTLGGTLNATTEQAAEDKRRQIEDDKNRTILSHGGSYTTDTPLMQAPLNSTVAAGQGEPEIRDIFNDPANVSAPTEHAEAIQPPAPVAQAPTLADLDIMSHREHDDARAAIDAALGGAPGPAAPVADAVAGLPPLPPLPPMPDFSTLPPLPGEAPAGATGTTEIVSVPDTLGDGLPPAPAPEAPKPNDPAQFKIPGQ